MNSGPALLSYRCSTNFTRINLTISYKYQLTNYKKKYYLKILNKE